MRLFTLANAHGMRAEISDHGGIITRLMVPDRDGAVDDVVLGFDRLDDYLPGGRSPYFGALIGRYANRIAHGRFVLDGRRYQLPTNHAPSGRPCTLHGGPVGFDQRLWAVDRSDGTSLRLHYRSGDGEQGFPGTVDVTVSYAVDDRANALHLRYEACCDAPTIVNLTNHSYFNLAGAGRGDITRHRLTIRASAFTPVDAGLIPTGEFQAVAGTAFDFRTGRLIGDRIDETDQQLRHGLGYDHNWVLDGHPDGELALAARLEEPGTGRVLEVLTDQPGLQFYSGNQLPSGDQAIIGKGGRAYAFRGGLALETQHFPDSPNHPAFPSTVLRPGETFRSHTIFRFSVMR